MNFSIKYFLFVCAFVVQVFMYGQKNDITMNTALLIVDIQNDYFKGGRESISRGSSRQREKEKQTPC